MVSSVTCWYDVLVWGKWKNFGWWCDRAICPYRCAKKTVHRIGSHIVHKWERYDLSSPIVQYVRVCHQMGSRVVQLYGMIPHMDMLIHVQHREQSIQSIFNSTFLYDEVVWYFSQSSMCASTFSQHIINDFWLNQHSTFSFSSSMNLIWTFIFALILLYWYSVKPSLQRYFTFDMLFHNGHWSLWLVTVMMYGRFHPRLLNVIRH